MQLSPCCTALQRDGARGPLEVASRCNVPLMDLMRQVVAGVGCRPLIDEEGDDRAGVLDLTNLTSDLQTFIVRDPVRVCAAAQ